VPAVGFWPVMFASYRIVAAIPALVSKAFISASGMPPASSSSILPLASYVLQGSNNVPSISFASISSVTAA
jgi:hypothetical protein